MPEFKFIRWYDPYKAFAVFEVVDLKQQFIVPRSRLIPTPAFEYTHPEIRDPNLLAEMATEANSVFGVVIFRWWLHKSAKGNLMEIDEDDIEKAYYFPPTISFSCVRDCVVRGEDTDICIADCSSF
jgi:hypothetical protein